ncbi:MAG: DUF4974 domain-containing protein, partial [Pedobacter sp.]
MNNADNSRPNINAKELLRKYADGVATDVERDLFEQWYMNLNRAEHQMLSEEELEATEQLLLADLMAKVKPAKSVKLFPMRWVAVAAAVATIVFGVYFFTNNYKGITPAEVTHNVADVAPGKQGATLTLANGKKIKLSDAVNGQLAQQSGVVITKTADGQLVYEIKEQLEGANQTNTLSTANGETYQVRLPDGSLVWLNSASSLTYTASLFERGRRVVKLSGEGYFEVAKDKAHPFVVETDQQEVEVLGTQFNVNSYESIKATTLVEGSIKIADGDLNQILKPGEQGLNDGVKIKVGPANIAEAIAWKEGYFRFNDEKMSSIVKKLERWYDVEIVLSDNLAEQEFTGKIARNRNVSRVLKMMEKTNSIQ